MVLLQQWVGKSIIIPSSGTKNNALRNKFTAETPESAEKILYCALPYYGS
jgi:hypothetical protein